MAKTSDNVVVYSKELLEEVRQKLKETVDKENDPCMFDEKEYQRLLSDDDHLKRYVKRKKGDVQAAVTFLVEVLKWRQRFGIPDFTEQSFPTELYDLSGAHLYEDDKDGNVVLIVRINFFSKIPEILELLKKYTVFHMLKADEEAAKRGGDHGWVLLFDCTGAGLANADLDMATFINSTLRNYFPSGQKYVLINNLPWLLNAIKTIFWTILPSNVKKQIKFSNDKTITEYIPRENLPDYMGGTSSRPYRVVPKVALSTDDLVSAGTLKIGDDGLTRVRKYYEKIYDLHKLTKKVEDTALPQVIEEAK